MNKKVVAILCCCAIALGSGTAVAYYNTKTFGFDENAKVISYDKEKINIMDYSIYYKDIEKISKKISSYLPENIRTI